MGVEEGGLTPRSPVFQELADAEIGGDVEELDFVEEVVGLLGQMDAVDFDSAGIDLFVGGVGGGFGDDVDFHAFVAELVGELVDVGADAADDAGRILPGEHDDPH